MATLTEAFRKARAFSAGPDRVPGLLLYSMVLLATAAVVARVLTGSFFAGPGRDSALALALKREGEQLYNARRYEAAAEKLQQAATYDPENARIHFLLANAYVSMGETKLGLEELRDCIKYDSGNSAAQYMIYRLTVRTDPQGAVRHLRLAKESDPGSPYLDVEMAQAYRNAGNPAKALEWARTALRKTPPQSNYRRQLQAYIAELEGAPARAGKR